MNLIAGMIAMLALVIGSCAGDDETPKSLYSEACSRQEDCATNLTCFPALGICSQSCGTTQDCIVNLGSQSSVCIGGVCQVQCDATEYAACSEYGVQCVQSGAGSTCRQRP